MRKKIFSVLMIPLLLLTGCGRRQAELENDFAAFRDAVQSAKTLSFEIELHCRDGQTVEEYTLRVSQQDDRCRVTVIEPSLLSGVTAAVGSGGAELGYEGVSLGVGSFASLTPASAAPAMVKAMRYGYEELLWREDDYTVARLWLEDGAVMTLWLDENTVPVCAEISEDGMVGMSAVFSGWELSAP